MLKRHIRSHAEDPEVFSAIADIATLVAYYNILANIFHQWLAMGIDADYDNELIKLTSIPV